MKIKLALVGAGGFGREVAWQFSRSGALGDNYSLWGFFDDAPALAQQTLNGVPVIGDVNCLARYPEACAAVICIGNAKIKKKVAERLCVNPLISFPTMIADNVRYSDTVRFGKGCIICLSNILTVNIELGDFVIVNLDCTIGHDTVIEDYATLYPSVNVSGNVRIGACTEIGTGTHIIQGKKIGVDSVVGAGSVVIRDIPDYCTAVGVPAVPIKFHNGLHERR